MVNYILFCSIIENHLLGKLYSYFIFVSKERKYDKKVTIEISTFFPKELERRKSLYLFFMSTNIYIFGKANLIAFW